MRHWFNDRHFKSLLKNSSYLAVSKAIAAVAALATLAFAGRSLGVLMFGTLILITSYAKAASGLSKFQSWQLIVRHGGQALASGENREFKAAIGFAFALDVVSGLGGMAGDHAAAAARGWSASGPYVGIAMLYCTRCRRWPRQRQSGPALARPVRPDHLAGHGVTPSPGRSSPASPGGAKLHSRPLSPSGT